MFFVHPLPAASTPTVSQESAAFWRGAQCPRWAQSLMLDSTSSVSVLTLIFLLEVFILDLKMWSSTSAKVENRNVKLSSLYERQAGRHFCTSFWCMCTELVLILYTYIPAIGIIATPALTTMIAWIANPGESLLVLRLCPRASRRYMGRDRFFSFLNIFLIKKKKSDFDLKAINCSTRGNSDETNTN